MTNREHQTATVNHYLGRIKHKGHITFEPCKPRTAKGVDVRW